MIFLVGNFNPMIDWVKMSINKTNLIKALLLHLCSNNLPFIVKGFLPLALEPILRNFLQKQK